MNQGALFDLPVPTPTKTIDRTIPVNIWLCGQEPGQKQRAGRYTAESFDHPAKMLPELARRIIETYSRPGDLILDPMAGIGTTGVEGMHLGRRVICVELEQKFVETARANFELAKCQGAPGEAWMIQGNARELSRIVADLVDQIVMSPPYGNRMKNTDSYNVRAARMRERGVAHDPRWDNPAGHTLDRQAYSSDAANIGNLQDSRYGSIDEIIFSPPYPNANVGGGLEARRRRGKLRYTDCRIGNCATRLSDDPNNIDNLKEPKTYLGEMFKVYRECFSVLRPGGHMVVVTRDFRRDGDLFDLSGDTIRLCQAAGFQYRQRVIALLCSIVDGDIRPRASFWQIRYARAMAARGEPILVVQHEDVLVFRKTGGDEDAKPI